MLRAAAVAASLAAAAALPPTALTRRPHRKPVPILMYHIVSPPPHGAPFPELYVRPKDFARQIRWLARHGYHAVTLLRVYDYWTKGRRLPRRPIVISFDDGYLSQYTRAFPVLRAHRWPGVLNLEVRHLRPVGGLRPWRVRKMIAAGWELDSHTITHPDLTKLGKARLKHEVAGSRRLLRRKFHVPVDFFCYPSGRFNARVIVAVRRAGFLGATTTKYGLARPPRFFTLSRIRIEGTDGLRGFAAKLKDLTR